MTTVVRWAAGAAALAAMLLLGGCASSGPAHGVLLHHGEVVLRYKPCETAYLSRVKLFDDREDRLVWSAKLRKSAASDTAIAIEPHLDGYVVHDRLGTGGPKPGVVYRAEATSTKGDHWGGPVFDRADLREGKVQVAGGRLDARDWVHDQPNCRKGSAVGIAAAALFTAGVTAVVMAVILGPLYLLRRAALRRRAAQEGTDQPWLHHDDYRHPWLDRWRRR